MKKLFEWIITNTLLVSFTILIIFLLNEITNYLDLVEFTIITISLATFIIIIMKIKMLDKYTFITLAGIIIILYSFAFSLYEFKNSFEPTQIVRTIDTSNLYSKTPAISYTPNVTATLAIFRATNFAEFLTFQSNISTQTATSWTPTPTNLPSETRQPSDTPTVQPTVIAQALYDEYGFKIGDGVFKLYTSQNKISHGESLRVELEITFYAHYITPTPAGGITRIPVISLTPDLLTPISHITPTLTFTPIATSTATEVFYESLTVNLTCSAGSFIGCTEQSKYINITGDKFVWILTPSENARGTQDLDVAVYTQTYGNPLQRKTLWDYSFQVEVTPGSTDDGGENKGLPIAIWVALITTFGGIFAASLPYLVPAIKSLFGKKSKNETTLITGEPDVKIFINYRRNDSEAWAKLIYEKIKLKFPQETVFRDIEGIDYGDDFEVKIKDALQECDACIVVIGKNWLKTLKARIKSGETDYVHQEIAIALRENIRVIPALVSWAEMPSEDQLPDALKKLANCNAISFRNDSFDSDIERLISQLIKKKKA